MSKLSPIPMALLIQRGTVVTAEGRRRADVRCRGGQVVEIGPHLEPQGEERLDADGLLVLPGGVDPHVHLSLPVAGTVSADDFASGTTAALAGGTTTILDFVHPERGEPYLEAIAARRREAEEALCDYGLHLGVTWWGPESPAWIERAAREEGIPSCKLYLAYKATVGLDDREIVAALDAIAAIRHLGGLALVHAEHGDVIELLRERLAAAGELGPRSHALSRPPETEAEATGRIALLAALTGAPVYVVHVTCAEAAGAVAAARARGWPVSGETCPHYLLLDDSVYDRPWPESAAGVVSPPLRPRGHREALWRALAEGVLEVVATDHCPFTRAQKEAGRNDFRKIPGGAPGIEHRLALLHTHGVLTGRITMERFVDLVSTAPAKRFGLWPRKGAIEVGSDADLVLWDPAATATIAAATHRHRTDLSLFEGFEVTGRAAIVVGAGEVRYREGEILAPPGSGRFLPRRPARRGTP